MSQATQHPPTEVRTGTAGQVFTSILTTGPVCRRDVANATGLSQASVTKLVKPMLSAGYIEEIAPITAGPGRPQIPLQVIPERQFSIGVKVMATEVIGVVIDLGGNQCAAVRQPVDGTDPDEVVGTVTALVAHLRERVPQARERTCGIGVGIGGHVDNATGVVRFSPSLRWPSVPLAGQLTAATGLPVTVENDVNSLALSEQWFGAGRGVDSFAVVTVGAGIGCGLVIDGDLWTGVSGAAGEFGHIRVAADGARCDCGRVGCVQAVANDEAIARAAEHAVGQPISSAAEAYRLATAGSEPLKEVFREAGRALGRGLAVLVNLMNPALVILSGEGVHSSPIWTDAVREQLTADAFSSIAMDCELLVRPLPDEAWAAGAAVGMLRRSVLGSLGRLGT